jgi:hypothetical protein
MGFAHLLYVCMSSKKSELSASEVLHDLKIHFFLMSFWQVKDFWQAPLRFEFVKDVNNSFKMVTYYNHGKDAEWTKTH